MRTISISIILLLINSCHCFAVIKESPIVALCQASLLSGDYEKALSVCEKQLALSIENHTDQDSVLLYLKLIDIYHATGNSDQEDYYLAKVKNHPLYLQNIVLQYSWSRKIGQKKYLLNQLNQAKTHLYHGLRIAINENNLQWMSKSYNDVGLIENKLNNYKSALVNYKKSLELKRQNGDLYQIGSTLNNLGLVHLNLEEYEKASQYYEQALETFLQYTSLDNFDKRVSVNISHLYEDLSITYIRTNNIEKASDYAEKILRTFTLKFSAHDQARALINVAKLYIVKEEYSQAQQYLKKAQNQENLSAEIFYELAKIHNRLEDNTSAIYYAQKGLQSAKNNNHALSIDFYKLLSELYQNSHIEKAFEYLQKYQVARENFINKKYNSELTTVQYRIEKQQIQHDLMAQQLENTQSQAQIQKLNNRILLALILLLSSMGFTFFYYLKKKKEKEALLQSINYHKQQLLMFDHENAEQLQKSNTDIKADFKQQLVKTFVEVINVWEKHTGTNRVEFAQQSKLWTISIDEGTLRTRSLDKYLRLDKIPQNPKWRKIIRSCHFVLSDHSLNIDGRKSLTNELEKLMALVKELSLSPS